MSLHINDNFKMLESLWFWIPTINAHYTHFISANICLFYQREEKSCVEPCTGKDNCRIIFFSLWNLCIEVTKVILRMMIFIYHASSLYKTANMMLFSTWFTTITGSQLRVDASLCQSSHWPFPQLTVGALCYVWAFSLEQWFIGSFC